MAWISTSGNGDILGGKVITEEGASKSLTVRDEVTVDLPPPKAGTGGGDGKKRMMKRQKLLQWWTTPTNKWRKKEKDQFEKTKEDTWGNHRWDPWNEATYEYFVDYQYTLGLAHSVAGWKQPRYVSKLRSRYVFAYEKLLEVVTKVIVKMPEKLTITGHTDAVWFSSYSKWELSADRANSARREL